MIRAVRSNGSRRFQPGATVALLILLSAAITALAADIKPNPRPNVLFIVADDLNDWQSCLQVNPDVKTPNLDRLASRGQLFTAAQCAAPVCNPSRTALLSGLLPSTSGCYENEDPWTSSPKLMETIPLPGYFKQHGYYTVGVGKVFHGPGSPEKQKNVWNEFGGTFAYGPHEGKQVRSAMDEAGNVTGPNLRFLHWGPLNQTEEKELSDYQIANWVSERLQRKYEQPFFMAAGFRRPHEPLTAPQRFFDLYPTNKITLPPQKADQLAGLPRFGAQAATMHFYAAEGGDHRHVNDRGQWLSLVQAYLACVSYVDSCIGTTLDSLAKSPYATNTIVVFFADNGWGLGERFHWEKWGLWNGVARIPLIIYAPGLTKPGVRCNTPVSLIDLYPTLVDLCSLPKNSQLDGISLKPLLANSAAPWSRPALTTLGPNNHSLRNGKWRYIHWSDGSEELYDEEKDPREWTNLAAKPECLPALKEMRGWLPKVNAPAIGSHTPGKDFHLKQNQRLNFLAVEPEAVGVSISVKAKISEQSTNGVIFSHGNNFAGYALYMKNGRLNFAVKDVPGALDGNQLVAKKTIITAPKELPSGPVEVEGTLEIDGVITLKVNGRTVASGKCNGPLSLAPAGVMIAGRAMVGYPRYAPIGDYASDDHFKGKIDGVDVHFGSALP